MVANRAEPDPGGIRMAASLVIPVENSRRLRFMVRLRRMIGAVTAYTSH